MRSTLLTACLASTWKLVKDHGYNPDGLFQEAGIDPGELRNAGGRIDFNRVAELLLKVDKLFQDPCLGLEYGNYWHPSNYHALGYAWLSSKTLRDALTRLVRYAKILSEGLVFELSENEDDVYISVEFTFDYPPSLHRFLATTMLAVVVSMCRMNYGKNLNPLSVTFKHAEPDCSDKHFEFFQSEVIFGAGKDSIAFSSGILDKALIGQNPDLSQYADKVAARYLAKLDKADIAQRVKIEIVEMMPFGDVTARKIAKKLYLSNRSFNRRLNEAGTSFRNLLEETRREMVSKYQQDKNVHLREIPYLLGYKNYSSFFRAYKRWTGRSPSGLMR